MCGQGTKFPDERGESSRFSGGLLSAVDLCRVKLRETIKMWPGRLGPSLSGEDITHTATGMVSLTWAFSPGPLLPPLTCGQGPSQFRVFWGGHERSPGVPSGGGSGYAQSDHLPSLSCVIDLGAEFHPW